MSPIVHIHVGAPEAKKLSESPVFTEEELPPEARGAEMVTDKGGTPLTPSSLSKLASSDMVKLPKFQKRRFLHGI